MPVKTEVNVEKNLFIHYFSESVCLQSILQTIDNTLAHPGYSPGMNAIWVCEDGTEVNMNSQDSIQVSNYARQTFGKSQNKYKLALVASEDLAYGMHRVYAGWSNDRPIAINTFRKLDEALYWIEE